MGQCNLIDFGDHDFFRIRLGVKRIIHHPVADSEKKQALLFKSAGTEVRKIPSQIAIENFPVTRIMPSASHFLRTPAGKFRQFEAE